MRTDAATLLKHYLRSTLPGPLGVEGPARKVLAIQTREPRGIRQPGVHRGGAAVVHLSGKEQVELRREMDRHMAEGIQRELEDVQRRSRDPDEAADRLADMMRSSFNRFMEQNQGLDHDKAREAFAALARQTAAQGFEAARADMEGGREASETIDQVEAEFGRRLTSMFETRHPAAA